MGDETTQARGSERPIRSARDFCRRYFPKAHTAKECRCYRAERPGVLVIQPRSGRQIRVR